jgi:hypothetical protein
LEIACAPAEQRGIDRQHDRLAATCLRTAQKAHHHIVVGAPIQLKPASFLAHHRSACFHRDGCLAGKDHRYAFGCRRPRNSQVCCAMRQFEHTDRGQQHGCGKALAKQRDVHVAP